MSQEQYDWQYFDTKRRICITVGLIDIIQWDDDCAVEPFIGYQIDEIK